MARAALPGRLEDRFTGWREAELVERRRETPRAHTLRFSVPGWQGHLAGQHVDVRLVADDGYQAQRSYSIASAPGEELIALTVDRLDDGEVSPYLTDELRPGDRLELRGPIGGWFVWRPEDGASLLLVGGGSGFVPLMAILRHRATTASSTPTRVLISAGTLSDVLFREELEALQRADPDLEVRLTLTRERPAGWAGYTRRVDGPMLADVAPPPSARPTAFVCGPTRFVEAAADALVALGHPADHVKTERFGPSGS